LDSCFFIENIIDAQESEEDSNTEAIIKDKIEIDIDKLLNAIENGKAPVETPLDAAIEEEIEEEEDQELNNLAEKIITDLESDKCKEIVNYYENGEPKIIDSEKDKAIEQKNPPVFDFIDFTKLASEPERMDNKVSRQTITTNGGSRKTLKKRSTKRANKKSNKKNTKRRGRKH
jgi:hypothetical protein